MVAVHRCYWCQLGSIVYSWEYIYWSTSAEYSLEVKNTVNANTLINNY